LRHSGLCRCSQRSPCQKGAEKNHLNPDRHGAAFSSWPCAGRSFECWVEYRKIEAGGGADGDSDGGSASGCSGRDDGFGKNNSYEAYVASA
jgi:hypothetical protein